MVILSTSDEQSLYSLLWRDFRCDMILTFGSVTIKKKQYYRIRHTPILDEENQKRRKNLTSAIIFRKNLRKQVKYAIIRKLTQNFDKI